MSIRPATRADLPEAVAEIRDARRVAVDTEFHAEWRYWPKLYLVQVQVEGDTTWLFDPLEPGLMDGIGAAMLATDWVVHGGQQDMRLLRRAFGGLPDRVLDTQIGAALVTTHYPAGYAKLVEQFVGHSISKSATLSDWSRRPLTPEQIEYAAEDVALLLPLWDGIERALLDADRLALAHEACGSARRAAETREDPHDAWRHIGAVPGLTAQQTAVLQELAAWREIRARKRNQPPRAIASDGVLLSLARRQPITRASMLANRRLPKALARDCTDELVEIIGRASQRPEIAWPASVRYRTPEWRRLSFLACFAEIESERRQFSAQLVLPRPILTSLVADPPPSRNALAERIEPFRDHLVGDRLWSALNGELALAIDGADVIATDGKN